MKNILHEVVAVHDKNMKERSNMQLLVKRLEKIDVIQKAVNTSIQTQINEINSIMSKTIKIQEMKYALDQ